MEFDKIEYKELKAAAKKLGIKFVTAQVFDEHYAGLAIAYVPATHSADCRMVEIAVSYCAIEDTFSPKVGKYQALCKMFNGQIVKMPLGEFVRDNPTKYVKESLLQLFAV